MTDATDADAQLTPVEVRERLVEALELDLVGPWPGHALARGAAAAAAMRPSNWYLTGFLIPVDAPTRSRRADADADDDFERSDVGGRRRGDHRGARRREEGVLPLVDGLSSFVAAERDDADRHACAGATTSSPSTRPSREDGEEPKPLPVWQRTPREEHGHRDARRAAGRPRRARRPGLRRPASSTRSSGRSPTDGRRRAFPPGTRSVSVFLVNRRTPDAEQPDLAYAFQPELEVQLRAAVRPAAGPARRAARTSGTSRSPTSTTPTRPSTRPATASRPTGSSSTAQCRAAPHALDPERRGREDRRPRRSPASSCRWTRSARSPTAPRRARRSRRSSTQYRGVDRRRRRRSIAGASGEARARPRERAARASRGLAADRIERGIEVLADDADALDAFRVANRAVARGARAAPRRIDEPAWRAFQLAFILLNLPGPRRPARRRTARPSTCSSSRPAAARPRRTSASRRSRWCCGGCATRATKGLRGRRRERDHALHAAAADARPARPRRRPRLRAGARARAGRRRATATWPFEIGLWVGKAGDAEHHGPQGRRALGHRPHEGPPVQDRPEGQAVADPAREVPWCGDALHAGLVHAAARRRPPERAAHRLRELRVRLHPRPRAADRRRRRADLPAAARRS